MPDWGIIRMNGNESQYCIFKGQLFEKIWGYDYVDDSKNPKILETV